MLLETNQPEKRDPLHAVRCQARGCEVELQRSGGNAYCARRKLCPRHMKAMSVQLEPKFGDEPHRFCQQCGKLEPVACFDGNKRNCRMRLARRRNSRADRLRRQAPAPGHDIHSNSSNNSGHSSLEHAECPGSSTPLSPSGRQHRRRMELREPGQQCPSQQPKKAKSGESTPAAAAAALPAAALPGVPTGGRAAGTAAAAGDGLGADVVAPVGAAHMDWEVEHEEASAAALTLIGDIEAELLRRQRSMQQQQQPQQQQQQQQPQQQPQQQQPPGMLSAEPSESDVVAALWREFEAEGLLEEQQQVPAAETRQLQCMPAEVEAADEALAATIAARLLPTAATPAADEALSTQKRDLVNQLLDSLYRENVRGVQPSSVPDLQLQLQQEFTVAVEDAPCCQPDLTTPTAAAAGYPSSSLSMMQGLTQPGTSGPTRSAAAAAAVGGGGGTGARHLLLPRTSAGYAAGVPASSIPQAVVRPPHTMPATAAAANSQAPPAALAVAPAAPAPAAAQPVMLSEARSVAALHRLGSMQQQFLDMSVQLRQLREVTAALSQLRQLQEEVLAMQQGPYQPATLEQSTYTMSPSQLQFLQSWM